MLRANQKPPLHPASDATDKGNDFAVVCSDNLQWLSKDLPLFNKLKALMFKNLNPTAEAKSAFFLELKTYLNHHNLNTELGISETDLTKLDNFLAQVEDHCLSRLFSRLEMLKLLTFDFCKPNCKKCDKTNVEVFNVVAAFCGLDGLPSSFIEDLIRFCSGIEEMNKQRLINNLYSQKISSEASDISCKLKIGPESLCDSESKTGRNNRNNEALKIEQDNALCNRGNYSVVKKLKRSNQSEEMVSKNVNVNPEKICTVEQLPTKLKNTFTGLKSHKNTYIADNKNMKETTITTFACPLCGLDCCSNKVLKVHLKSHINQHKCSFCGSLFRHEASLTQHLETHSNLKSGENLNGQAQSELNLKSHKACRKSYKCKKCQEVFTYYPAYETHIRTHSKSCYLKCGVCNKFIKGKAKLKRHELVHSGRKPFSCELCGAAFADQSHLNVHHRVHSGEKPFKCPRCDAAFSESSKLRNHLRTHTSEKPCVCEFCGVCCTTLSSLRNHMRTHPGQSSTSEFSTSNMSNLNVKPQSGEKKHTCEMCGASFTETAKLKRHKMVHTGEQPFSCEVCGKRFADKSHLTVHLRIHSGERPFKCTFKDCQSAFVEKSKLKNHVRRHTGEKPYICEVCGTSFAVSYSLKSHMRTHTGEKPYNCKICGYSTSQSSNLRTHMNVHNGKRPHPCDNCGASFSELSKLNRHKSIHFDPNENESLDPQSRVKENGLNDNYLNKETLQELRGDNFNFFDNIQSSEHDCNISIHTNEQSDGNGYPSFVPAHRGDDSDISQALSLMNTHQYTLGLAPSDTQSPLDTNYLGPNCQSVTHFPHPSGPAHKLPAFESGPHPVDKGKLYVHQALDASREVESLGELPLEPMHSLPCLALQKDTYFTDACLNVDLGTL